MDIDNENEMAAISNHVLELRNSDVYVPTDMTNYNNREEGTPLQSRIHVAYLVVDTNFLLSHLNMLSDLERLLHGRYRGVYQIIIPKQVVHELDGLKDSSKRVSAGGGIQSRHSISALARKAIDWCYAHFHDSEPTVSGQRLHEKIDRDALKDNSILDCCLYFQNVENGGGNMVVLLSDDKNLCVKALVNNVLTISYRSDMTAQLIAENILNELTNNGMFSYANQVQQQFPQQEEYSGENNSMDMMMDDDYAVQEQSSPRVESQNQNSKNVTSFTFHDVSIELSEQVTTLVLESINFAVMEVFGEDTDLSGYKSEDLKNLTDAVNCILRMKISTFSEFFDRRSSFNPMRTLEKRSERNKYTRIPGDILELQDFVSFWYDFLDGIYKKRSPEQRQSLKQVYSHWQSRIGQIS